jgi:hypothetical protein
MGKERLYYEEARRLFLAGHGVKRIQESLPEKISTTTLSKWRQKGGWDKELAAVVANRREIGEILRETLIEKIRAIRESRELSAADFDGVAKATASIERLERGAYDLRTAALGVMAAYTAWLKKQDLAAGELQAVGERLRAWFKSLE